MATNVQKSQTPSTHRRWAIVNGYVCVEGQKLFKKEGDTLLFWHKRYKRDVPFTREELEQVFECN